MVTPTARTREDFLQECRAGKLDGVVAAYRTFNSFSITGMIDAELVEALPKSMKFLAHCGMLHETHSALCVCEKAQKDTRRSWMTRVCHFP